jgi:hypothetical protein
MIRVAHDWLVRKSCRGKVRESMEAAIQREKRTRDLSREHCGVARAAANSKCRHALPAVGVEPLRVDVGNVRLAAG